MAPERSLWIRLLIRLGALRASDAELGDVMEEYATGNRHSFWVAWQILSAVRWRRSHLSFQEGRSEMLSSVRNDIRYALRTLRRNPGFAAAALVPIALGIGINTGLFSILNSVALRPLPTPDSTELVTIHQEFRGVKERRVHGARSLFSIPEYRVYRDATRTLSGVMAYSRPSRATLGGHAAQEIEGVLVTCNYFDVLRMRPSIGTGFTAANCGTPDAAPSVILSHALWARAFAADPDIVRKSITLNGENVAVVGVAPEGFDGIDLTKTAFFAPTSLQRLLHAGQDFHEHPHTSWLMLVGRRTDRVGLAQVRAELAVIAGRIDRQQPGRTTTLSVAPATTLSLPVARRDVFSVAFVVLAAFGLVLLIACANVANLLLARAAGRTREIAVRLSVGASRGRLIRQLLTESLVVALIGGAAGTILAWWTFQGLLVFLLSILPGTIPPLRIDAAPDLTVLWFALGLTVLTAVVFGMLPAIQSSRSNVQAALKYETGEIGRRSGGWLRGSLIGVQVAVCTVLLISAGLLLRALYAAQTIEPGFEYRKVAMVSYALRGYDEDRMTPFHQRLMERVAALAGVDSVAHVGKMPLSPGRRQTMFRFPGQAEWHEVDVNTVSAEFFSLLAIPIVRGRTFAAAELADSSRAVIVTEATARRYWPTQDPIGQTIVVGRGRNDEVSLEIVGVARDANVSGLAETASSYMYLPATASAQRGIGLLVRSNADFAALASGIRGVMRELDPGVVVRVNRLEENLDFWRTISRMAAGLSGSLGMLALLLASVGVYGVVSYVVSRRVREVGIRMMLGATANDVQGMILRQTLRPVAVGALIGIAGAAAASGVLQGVLFGISPLDPIAFTAAPFFLLAVAAAASMLPTRGALKVDPMATLRYE